LASLLRAWRASESGMKAAATCGRGRRASPWTGTGGQEGGQGTEVACVLADGSARAVVASLGHPAAYKGGEVLKVERLGQHVINHHACC